MPALYRAMRVQGEVTRFAASCLVLDRQAALRPADAALAWNAWARARELPAELRGRPRQVAAYITAWCMHQPGWEGLAGAPYVRGVLPRPGIGPVSWAGRATEPPPRGMDAAIAWFAGSALLADPQAAMRLPDLDRLWMAWAAYAGYPLSRRGAGLSAVHGRVGAWARDCLSRAPLSPSDQLVRDRQPRNEFTGTALGGIRLADDLPVPLEEEDHAAAE